jgi:hypothetical protein
MHFSTLLLAQLQNMFASEHLQPFSKSGWHFFQKNAKNTPIF